MNGPWKSPLKQGQKIATEDGFIVQVLEDPEENSSGKYEVKVFVIAGPSRTHPLVGTIQTWGHYAPHLFVHSKIALIDGIELSPEYSLEEEFFTRRDALKSYEEDRSLQALVESK